MPTLFISYKRGTSAVAPLMERLQAANYRLWFDRDEIHLGDPDWQARIDQGLERCDGVILNLTPAALESEPVRYEVEKAKTLGKPIFPIVLEHIDNWGRALEQVGLTASHHTEDFTDVEKWDEQVKRLLRDLKKQGLQVTRHEMRERPSPDNPRYIMHQTYLKKLAERVGTLNLARINPENAQGIELEQVYVDSPVPYAIGIKVNDYHITEWWVSQSLSKDRFTTVRDAQPEIPDPKYPDGWDDVDALNQLVHQADERLQTKKADLILREKRGETIRRWEREKDGIRDIGIGLSLNNLAAAISRLVILGDPGSGKSTFVKYLALCLAGAGIDGWKRAAGITALDNWPHGALTPVYVELRRFVASKHFPGDPTAPVTADHLWSYITGEILSDERAVYADDLKYDLEHGYAVLILDGLDEVPYPEGRLQDRQNQLIGLAQSLNTRYANSRIIVASRPYAYEGWTLPGFEAVTITAFEDQHRRDLAQRLYQASGLAEKAAEVKAEALNQQLRQIDPELKDRPLFVTLMATIYLKGESEGLPTRRGALYRESILLLLDRWTQSKEKMPSLVKLLGDKHVDDLYNRLAALAYDIHNTYGDQPGTPEIDEPLLYRHLKPLGRTTAAELIPYLSENAGVLVSPGQDDERDVFRFAHRTFQEYLAAAHLTTTCLDADSFHQIAQHITSKPQIWRVPGTLMGDVLADTDRRGDLWELLEDLLDDDALDDMASDNPGWWRVWLAAVIAAEQKLHKQPKLRRSERTVRNLLVERIVDLIETAQALEPVERAEMGRILSDYGDTRPGVGVCADGLPDIVWSDVPAGAFTMGSDKAHDEKARDSELPQHEVTLDAFQIAKYPVTNAQFAPFVAGDGYTNRDYWTDAGWETRELEGWTEPRYWNDIKWNLPNHPVVGVSWYEAYAYCRWLSAKLGVEARLPTEAEWEKAARGTEGRIYPYGEVFDAAKGNVRETGIGQTSAVGIFPDGASPYDILDMSGNVFERCGTKWRENYETAADDDPTGEARRVLRGGSFDLFNDFARAAARYYDYPYDRDFNFGLRLCRRPPS